jgi:tight adherence protein C
MGFAIFAFTVMFLLIASGGLLFFYREEVHQRIADAIAMRSHEPESKNTFQRTGSLLASLVKFFEKMLPKSKAETSVMRQRLAQAGYRNDTAINFFYGTKVLVPLIFCALVLASGQANFILCAAALGLGFLLPDFWLGRKITARKKRIRLGLPDVLDLLVICIEAGLGIDQATARTVKELHHAQPDICDELGIVVLEQRAGRARTEAWKNMADRTDVDCVRNYVSMLIQSEQFGTGIARTLRIHSDTLRTERIQLVEEMAAKTTIKLIFPLVLFIFPSLFVVTLGPAVILMSDSFDKFFKN